MSAEKIPHPGYHTLSANSWWCDNCLEDCTRLVVKIEKSSDWQEFYRWSGAILARSVGLSLASLMTLIIFIIGRDEWQQNISHDQLLELRNNWHGQVDSLLLTRDKLLLELDRLSAEYAKALVDSAEPGADVIRDKIDRCQHQLYRTMDRLHHLEKKLRDTERWAEQLPQLQLHETMQAMAERRQ